MEGDDDQSYEMNLNKLIRVLIELYSLSLPEGVEIFDGWRHWKALARIPTDPHHYGGVAYAQRGEEGADFLSGKFSAHGIYNGTADEDLARLNKRRIRSGRARAVPRFEFELFNEDRAADKHFTDAYGILLELGHQIAKKGGWKRSGRLKYIIDPILCAIQVPYIASFLGENGRIQDHIEMTLQESDWGAPDRDLRHAQEQQKVERARAAWDEQERYAQRSPSPPGRWGTPDRDPPRQKKKEGWGEWVLGLVSGLGQPGADAGSEGGRKRRKNTRKKRTKRKRSTKQRRNTKRNTRKRKKKNTRRKKSRIHKRRVKDENFE